MFKTPFGLSSPHLQTILSSIGPSKRAARRAFAPFAEQSQKIILDCKHGVRLGGVLNKALGKGSSQASQTAILIHGWEGSSESSYMLSLAACLLNQGIDVLRLNLRDHGDTHHLNEGLFNSTLVAEVVSAIEVFQQEYSSNMTHLIGFSLGGNFTLRVAALAKGTNIKLKQVIAFCPVMHAGRSNIVLNSLANVVYGQYFVRKWKRSLRKKAVHFPQYKFVEGLNRMKSLDEMNRQLIPIYTDFTDLDEYFNAYAITGNVLEETICPCHLHFAKDDMIIPWEDIDYLADNPNLHITLTEKGGHCGYIKNWRFESWQDDRVLELIANAA